MAWSVLELYRAWERPIGLQRATSVPSIQNFDGVLKGGFADQAA